MEKINTWPSIKPEDVKSLRAFTLFLKTCCNAMEELRYLDELNMPANMKTIIQKLPYKLRERWRVVACDIYEINHHRAGFKNIVPFIEQQVKVLSDHVFGDIQDAKPKRGHK